MTVLSFKEDARISDAHRTKLRSFVSCADQNIFGLANQIGIKVVEEDMPDSISAVLICSPLCGAKSGYRVAVNRNHSVERKRMSIAHEIGHFVLHLHDSAFSAVTEEEHSLLMFEYRGGGRSWGEVVPFMIEEAGNSYRAAQRGHVRLEKEANAFMRALLMPPCCVRKNRMYQLKDFNALAKEFGVSRAAMTLQLCLMDKGQSAETAA
jgi:Zn-dependent peptidase ImmA (M78 family)